MHMSKNFERCQSPQKQPKPTRLTSTIENENVFLLNGLRFSIEQFKLVTLSYCELHPNSLANKFLESI